jgi:hypothetical protein
MATIPGIADLYGGDPSLTDGIPTSNNAIGTPKPAKLVARHEQYQKQIKAAIVEGLAGETVQVGSTQFAGQNVPLVKSKRVYQRELERGLDQNGLQKGHGEIISEHMEYLEKSSSRLAKEWQLTSPIPSGIVPYDLEAPSKNIWPKPTPLRNSIPRVKGQGSVRRFKVISAVSGSGTGGITTINPGIAENANVTTPTGQSYVRGPAISYDGFDVSQTYVTNSLSDYVSWQAEFDGAGFDDIRTLSATSLLYSSMLAEERLYLYGRGTVANGYVGPLGTAASVTLAAVSASVAPSGTTSPSLNSTSWVIVAADAGDLQTPAGAMHQGPSTVAASVSVSAGQAIQVTVGVDVQGALGYNLYVGSVSSGPFYLAGHTGYNVGYIKSQPSSGPTTTSGAADASALSVNYDGFYSNLGASAGYQTRLNAPWSTTSPGTEFQVAFASLYESTKSDPDEVWLNGFDRLSLSNALLNNAANSAYNVFIPNDTGMGNVKVGAVVTTLMNEVTGKAVDLNVHPWNPQGCAIVRQKVLPMPQTNISETTALACVQDYMQVAWPALGFTYDSSTFWVSTLCHYAPSYSGVIFGIAGSGISNLPPSDSDS